MLIVLLVYIVGLVWRCSIDADIHWTEYHSNQNFLFYSSSVIFFFLAIGFIVAGRFLRLEIKSFNEDYERTLRGKLIYATWIISIPFIIRSVYNTISTSFNFDAKVLGPSIRDNTWTAPIVYFFYIVLADLLPITSQLVSMLVVNDEVKNKSWQWPSSKISDTTDENLSLLEEEKDSFPVIFKGSTKQSTPPNRSRLLSGKFLTNDFDNREE